MKHVNVKEKEVEEDKWMSKLIVTCVEDVITSKFAEVGRVLKPWCSGAFLCLPPRCNTLLLLGSSLIVTKS